MYCLRVVIVYKNYIVYYNVYHVYKYIKFHLDRLLPPYHNACCLHVDIIRVIGMYHFRSSTTSGELPVLPEGVYCCFTRTTLFTTMYTLVCSM